MPRASLLLFLGLALLPPAAVAQSREQRLDRRMAVDQDVSIRIHNMAGSVRIEAWDRDTLAITGTISDAATNRFFIGGSRRAAKMGIEGPLELDQAPAHLFIRVPARAKVWVKSATANIVMSGLEGGIDAFSTSGNIRISQARDDAGANCTSGWIRMERIGGRAIANATSGWINSAIAVSAGSASWVAM